MENTHKSFKILSIDGGGIRGIFPAQFLADMEAQKGVRIHEQFDLICGTSTGGIIALGLALGIPAKEILDLYLENASLIFGKKRKFIGRLRHSAHRRNSLEQLIKQKFKNPINNSDMRISDCKTNILIPIYNLLEGTPSVLKSKYHPSFTRDYHIPAYIAALSTSAAPTYFDPYSESYTDLLGSEKQFHNKIDGGVYANNPALHGITEAIKGFKIPLSEISVLSIGTGFQKFQDAGFNQKKQRKNYGINYWMLQGNNKRLISVFMQAQSQHTQNIIKILKNGISGLESDNFKYFRIDTELDNSLAIDMDETNIQKLKILTEKASSEFTAKITTIEKIFLSEGRRTI